MKGRAGLLVAVAGVVLAVVVVLGGIFVFAADESEPDGGQAAGPAPTTQLSRMTSDPSGTEPVPDSPYREVPEEQVEEVDGELFDVALTEGRRLYIPVRDNDCFVEHVWPRGEHADRVVVDILPRMGPPSPGATTAADGSYGCGTYNGKKGVHAVIELAEPLGDRRLVVTYDYGTPPS